MSPYKATEWPRAAWSRSRPENAGQRGGQFGQITFAAEFCRTPRQSCLADELLWPTSSWLAMGPGRRAPFMVVPLRMLK